MDFAKDDPAVAVLAAQLQTLIDGQPCDEIAIAAATGTALLDRAVVVAVREPVDVVGLVAAVGRWAMPAATVQLEVLAEAGQRQAFTSLCTALDPLVWTPDLDHYWVRALRGLAPAWQLRALPRERRTARTALILWGSGPHAELIDNWPLGALAELGLGDYLRETLGATRYDRWAEAGAELTPREVAAVEAAQAARS